MRGGSAFGLALIAIVALATLEAMLPISRFLSKMDSDIFGVAQHIFVEEVLPRLAIGVAFVALAVHLHVRGNRLSWLVLLLVPVVVFAADALLVARSA
ncbi:MAG: hypothetical protein ABW023_00145 [Sphingomonas sp.]